MAAPTATNSLRLHLMILNVYMRSLSDLTVILEYNKSMSANLPTTPVLDTSNFISEIPGFGVYNVYLSRGFTNWLLLVYSSISPFVIIIRVNLICRVSYIYYESG